MCKLSIGENKEKFYAKQINGRCAGCGQLIKRWSMTYKWYICKECNSADVLWDIANHVMHPNE